MCTFESVPIRRLQAIKANELHKMKKRKLLFAENKSAFLFKNKIDEIANNFSNICKIFPKTYGRTLSRNANKKKEKINLEVSIL